MEAVLIEASTDERRWLAASFRKHHPDLKVVPAAETLLVYCNPASIESVIASLPTDVQTSDEQHHTVEIPVLYNGPDLERAAELANTSVEALIAWHQDGDWHADFGGFSPGFMYLTRSSEPVDFPRLETPRPKLEAGSVGLAGLFSGIYPQASPGGWNIIGHTDAPLWDIEREVPSLINPGDRVVFRSVS
ncbi:MAG: carboxyltransferase domain-containing protein [Corynebacterium sp.]|nr:carboxyltransferase domain-containing protein [Corynebacterium sp.]